MAWGGHIADHMKPIGTNVRSSVFYGMRRTLQPVLVMHVTPIENLRGIVARGGLWSDSWFTTVGKRPEIVTDKSIKAKRARCRVPGTNRVLADYVPFFFVPCNPMTYRLCRENMIDRLLFIVIDTDDYFDDDEIVFTDRHALSQASFYRDLGKLHEVIDQPALWGKSWAGDDDLAKRLQAEFLVWTTARKTKFRGIAVASSRAPRHVEVELESASCAILRQ